MNQNSISTESDKAGIVSAVLCMVHCLIIPAAFLMKFWYSDGNTAPHLPVWWERLDYLFLVVSFLAVYHSAGHTLYKEIKASLWTFWAVLAVSIIFESTIHWLAYIASAGLIITHFVNLKRIRKLRLSQ